MVTYDEADVYVRSTNGIIKWGVDVVLRVLQRQLYYVDLAMDMRSEVDFFQTQTIGLSNFLLCWEVQKYRLLKTLSSQFALFHM